MSVPLAVDLKGSFRQRTPGFVWRGASRRGPRVSLAPICFAAARGEAPPFGPLRCGFAGPAPTKALASEATPMRRPRQVECTPWREPPPPVTRSREDAWRCGGSYCLFRRRLRRFLRFQGRRPSMVRPTVALWKSQCQLERGTTARKGAPSRPLATRGPSLPAGGRLFLCLRNDLDLSPYGRPVCALLRQTKRRLEPAGPRSCSRRLVDRNFDHPGSETFVGRHGIQRLQCGRSSAPGTGESAATPAWRPE